MGWISAPTPLCIPGVQSVVPDLLSSENPGMVWLEGTLQMVPSGSSPDDQLAASPAQCVLEHFPLGKESEWVLCPGGSLGGKAGIGRRASGCLRGVFVGAPAAELQLWGGSCAPVLADPAVGPPIGLYGGGC